MEKAIILKKAIASSLVSKVVSLVYQLASMPILITYLGTEGFGLYSTLVALFGWIFLISGGINPGVTRIIARSGLTRVSQRFVYAAKSINLFLIMSVAIGLLFTYLFLDISKRYLFSFQSVALMLALVLPTIYFSISDSIRQGIGEIHINNLWATGATSVTVVLIFILPFVDALAKNTINVVIVIAYLPILLSKIANSYFLQHSYKKYNYVPPKYSKSPMRLYKVLMGLTFANLVIQVSVIINKSVVMLMMANVSLEEVARLELMFRFFMIAGTFFATIQQPLWPLITQAIKNKDKEWLTKVRNKLFFWFLSYSCVVLIITLLIGQKAFNYWSNGALSFSETELLMLSLFFMSIASNQACIVVLMGQGRFLFIGKTLILESTLLILLLFIEFFEFNFVGVLSSMLLARLATSTPILFIALRGRESPND